MICILVQADEGYLGDVFVASSQQGLIKAIEDWRAAQESQWDDPDYLRDVANARIDRIKAHTDWRVGQYQLNKGLLEYQPWTLYIVEEEDLKAGLPNPWNVRS